MREFDKWLRATCFKAPTQEAYDLARCAWEASQLSGWVSVDDYLPQVDFAVIVCCDDDVVSTTYREGNTDGEYWFDNIDGVTHWQPLPSPSEAKE